jgi:hypothetical protein
MIHAHSSLGGSRRGMIAAKVAICMAALLAVAAVTLDGGILQAERRRAQRAADAAAMAAAIDLFTNYNSTSGQDPDGTAAANGRAVAAANGYTNDGTESVVTINIPPSSGPYAGVPGYAEAIVEWRQVRFFGALWGSGRLPVQARAVARGLMENPNDGILVLDEDDRAAFQISGQNAVINVVGGGIVINSDNSEALTNTGTITAQDIDINGGYTGGGTFNIEGTIDTGVPPTPDPFRFIPEPTRPGSPAPDPITLRKYNGQNLNPDWTAIVMPRLTELVALGQLSQAKWDYYNTTADNINVYILKPGLYTNTLMFSNSTDLVFFGQASEGNGGIYYLERGITSNNATLLMDPIRELRPDYPNGVWTAQSGGIMLYNAGTGTADTISIAGNANGAVYLLGLDSGIYANFLLFNTRLEPQGTSNPNQTISITGNGDFTMLGTFYVPEDILSVTGNGTYAVIGAQYVSRTLTVAGNGIVQLNYTSRTAPYLRRIDLVE